MPTKTIIAKNVTGSPVTIADLGVTILGSGTYQLSDFFRLDELQESVDLPAKINASQIVINDGTSDLTLAQSINYITEVASRQDVSSLINNATSTPTASAIAMYDASGLLALKETGGPTTLKLGSVADGNFLQRSGSNIVGVSSTATNSDWKESVRAGTTANITLSGTQTIDGVSVIAGDRVLVKNQTTGADNGIYTVAAGAWSRATDADTSAKVTSGMTCVVEEGTLNTNTVWQLTTANPITLGTTSLTFSPSQLTSSAPANVDKSAASAGTGVMAARSDHKHDVSTAAPAQGIGGGNTEGTATTVSRSDHDHAIRETDGPTNLTVGAITDGDLVTRSSTTLVGSSPPTKKPCRVTTTANITLSGTQTIDGVSVVAGDRVLVKNQTTASQNGIYVCAAGAWSRATDADASAKVFSGIDVRVSEGTVAAGTSWYLSTADPITLGTTSLTFLQFSPVPKLEVNTAGTTTTTSTTDVLLTSATQTPGAGTYLVIFSTDSQQSSNGNSNTYSIYQNGSQVANSERVFTRSALNDRKPIGVTGVATVAAGQTIEIRWRVSAGTGTTGNRSFALIKVA